MTTGKIARHTQPDKAAARIKRGQTSPQEDSLFSTCSDQELFALIDDNNAQKRTSAIRILGERQNSAAVPLLCERLKKESALYTRIAISEALGKIGAPAIPELMRLLGQVGHNQHDSLPQKGFYKKSYPLPRDIVTRTLIKIGRPALKPLEQVVLAADRARLLEAVDGIGHIAFYQKDLSCEAILLDAYSKYPDDPVILWKIVRALQAFPGEKARRLLEIVICTNPYPALRWEAVRSLGQQGGTASAEVINCIRQDACAEVREMARIFLRA